VTHHRLEGGKDGLEPAGKLESPYVIRPTSETIIGHSFAKWINSYRDLPLLINQWANVMRWEMRTRVFLRTSEFLWQEGHTAHETKEEAFEETMKMLDIYSHFCHDTLAIPVISGEKTDSEKFPGADRTFTIEGMMQDGKALQAGTSHFLGRNFSKASEIKFLNRKGEEEYCWTTSWGVSTRLIGGLIMTHGDDNGMIVPPKIAKDHVVIIPIIHKDIDYDKVMNFCNKLTEDLKLVEFNGQKISVVLDRREMRGGEKTWSWIKKGIPLIVEVGPRDVDKNGVFVGRRDVLPGGKEGKNRDEFLSEIPGILADIQNTLYERAVSRQQEKTTMIDIKDDFYKFFKGENNGFALTHWNGSSEIEEKIKSELNVTIRCIPQKDNGGGPGICPFSGEKSQQRVLFAKSY
ncbi:proline--tRNA ligase, partial [Bacteriovoracaceae bacterium]|nr:proline--tRNA ligase [Bacteriovoracaceae bacterium]